MSITTTNSSVSHFPSGNGHAGGNFVFAFTLIPDANGDNMVDEVDRNLAIDNLGLSGTFADGDYSGNGIIGTEDSDLWEIGAWLDLEAARIVGDLNQDFRVDDSDLDALVGNYGMTSPTYADGDLNRDGHIDSSDMDLMFAQYGLELTVVS